MDDFLDAAFSGRFRFGIPENGAADVSIWSAAMMCWSCGAETMAVTRIEINSGPNCCYFPLSELGKLPKIMPFILSRLPGDLGLGNLGLGEIKFRYSRTMGARYSSNGCAHCGAFLGETFIFPYNSVTQQIYSFPARITPLRREILACHYSERWSVYPLAAC